MFQKRMKNNRKKVNNANADILSTVSIVDGDEVVERNNNEYIYLDTEKGIIVQPEEVETVKNRQAVDVLKNQLLGSFNSETGKYEISNNIELELKEVVKVETSRKGNAVFCESLSSFGGLGRLQFVVKTTAGKGSALSELFIFERVKKMSNTVVNTQIQLVAKYSRNNETYTDFDSLTFENYYRFAWEYFKIVKQNQMFYLSEDEKFLQGWIVRRKLYLKSMGLILDPSITAAESELLLTRIEILSGLGTYGYKILARFEELKNQAKKIVGGEELTARDQNEILEEAIETFRGQFEKEQIEFFKKQVDVVREYATTIATVKEQNHKEVLSDIEMRMPTVVEIIKRDDETKKIGAKARLDAEVASLEVNAKPTTQQVAENSKQVAEQQQAPVEEKNKTAKSGKASEQQPTEKVGEAQKKDEPAQVSEKGKKADTQTDSKGKTVEAQPDAHDQDAKTQLDAQKPVANGQPTVAKKSDPEQKSVEQKPAGKVPVAQAPVEQKPTASTSQATQPETKPTTPWTYEPSKKEEPEEKESSGLDEAIKAALIASALAKAQASEKKTPETDEPTDYYDGDYDDYTPTIETSTINPVGKTSDIPPANAGDKDPKLTAGPVAETSPAGASQLASTYKMNTLGDAATIPSREIGAPLNRDSRNMAVAAVVVPETVSAVNDSKVNKG